VWLEEPECGIGRSEVNERYSDTEERPF